MGPHQRYDVAALRKFAGIEVRVKLSDGATWHGWLRTEVLTERSLSVYVQAKGSGATLYIDQIAEILPLP